MNYSCDATGTIEELIKNLQISYQGLNSIIADIKGRTVIHCKGSDSVLLWQ